MPAVRAACGHLPIDRARAAGLSGPTHSLSLGLLAFTPGDLTQSAPLVSDRPYASLFFLSNGRRYLAADRSVACQPSLTLGVLGLPAATGKQLGTFSAVPIPAFGATAEFSLIDGTLTATDLSTGSALWTFSGDGKLVSAPIVIDNVVIIGSSSGTVYALDATAGNVVWSAPAGNAIAASPYQSLPTGMGAGDGYLVVPAGNVLNGWRLIQ